MQQSIPVSTIQSFTYWFQVKDVQHGIYGWIQYLRWTVTGREVRKLGNRYKFARFLVLCFRLLVVGSCKNMHSAVKKKCNKIRSPKYYKPSTCRCCRHMVYSSKFWDFWLVWRATREIDQASCHGWTQRIHSAFWLDGIAGSSRRWGKKGVGRSRLQKNIIRFVDDLKKACKKIKNKKEINSQYRDKLEQTAGFCLQRFYNHMARIPRIKRQGGTCRV